MSASRLIASFENHPYTKVEEEKVRDKILSLKPNLNHFEFCEFDKDEYPYLDGMYEEELTQRGWDQDESEFLLIGYVYTRKDLDYKDYRVIVCKEMIHSLDGLKEKTFTTEAINVLSEELTLPPMLKSVSCHTKRDKACLLLALSVLFPQSTRQKFLIPYQKEEISAKEISDLTLLPEACIEMLMTPAWAFVADKIIFPSLKEDDKDECGDEEERKFFREIAASKKKSEGDPETKAAE